VTIAIRASQALFCQGTTFVQNFSMGIEAGDFLLFMAFRRAEDSIGALSDVTGSGTPLPAFTTIGSDLSNTNHSIYAGYGIATATGTRSLRLTTGGAGGGTSVNSTLAGSLWAMTGVDPDSPILTAFSSGDLASLDPQDIPGLTIPSTGHGWGISALGCPARMMTGGLGMDTHNSWVPDITVDVDLSGTASESCFSAGHRPGSAGTTLSGARFDLSAASVAKYMTFALRELPTGDLSGLMGTTGLGL
jgi:hypothetical protein